MNNYFLQYISQLGLFPQPIFNTKLPQGKIDFEAMQTDSNIRKLFIDSLINKKLLNKEENEQQSTESQNLLINNNSSSPANTFPNNTNTTAKKINKPKMRLGYWSTEDELKLKELVLENSTRNWRKISDHFDDKTPKQCF